MARDFDGVDDIITATVTAVDSGDWTIAAWCAPDTAGEGSFGNLFRVETSGGSFTQVVLMASAARDVYAIQNFATTDALTRTSTVLTASAWACVVATYRDSDKKCRVYVGTLSAAMAEASYTTQTAGVGTRDTAGTVASIGSPPNTAETWDGKIGATCFDARQWTLDEMESFRQGLYPIPTSTMRGFWPLDSPTAAQAEDLSGNGAHGTVTGAIAAEGPPVAMRWGDSFGMTFTAAAAAAKVPVFMHSYRRRRAA